MLTIYKYPARITDSFTVEMPIGARVLTVQVQHGEPQIWALVDPQTKTEPRRFRLADTGHPIEESPAALRHVGTFQLHGGGLVFHLFEIAEPTP